MAPSSTFKGTLLVLILLLALASSAIAQDKSATSIIQLPSAGGTVTQEEGAFGLDSNSGSASFTLPLPDLPRRGRFGPDLTLSYSQFAGDTGGGLGIGWTLGVPSVVINDDLGTAIGGFKADGDFFSRLSLMGQRLVYLGRGDQGERRYRPEYSEQYVEIDYRDAAFDVEVLDRDGGRETITIPSGFEVRNPDGTRMIFSGDPAVAEGAFDAPSPYVTRWPLVLHVHPGGEAVRYEYVQHGGRSYLKRVSFAGGRSAYELDLIDTAASLVSHVTGSRQTNSKLYSRLTASFDGDVYNQWCFGYMGRSTSDNTRFAVRSHPLCQARAEADLTPHVDAGSINVLDQLRVLYRFGDTAGGPLTEATVTLPDIRFDYSSWTAADLAGREVVYEAPAMAWAGDIPPWTFELADLDMDALVDIVRTGDDATTVFAGEGSLASAFSSSSELTLSRPAESGLLRQVIPRLSDNRFHFADIFGDSYVDVLEIEEGRMHIYAGDAAGEFTYIGRSIPLPGVSPELFADGKARFQDVNMDGQSDILTTRLNADGRTEWQIFLNLTRRQSDGDHRVSFGLLQKAFPFESREGGVLSRRDHRITDLNGDRLPDLVVIQPARQGFCIYENRGNVFVQDPNVLLFGDASLGDPVCGAGRFVAVAGMRPDDRLETMWYVDANGDGILDFANMGNRTDELRIWLGLGDGSFLAAPLELDLNLRVQVGSQSRGFRSRVVDLDADGQSEILVFQKPSGNDVKAVVVLDFNRSGETQLAKANLMTTVEFGSGRRHDIKYATSTDEMLRDKARGVPFNTLHFPVVVAKQMVTSEGVPGLERDLVQTEEYFYHRPFYDAVNGKFLGFTEVEKVAYGDEFEETGEVTQRSSYTHEQFYTFAESAAALHLAGKLKVRKVYELAPDAALVENAEATVRIDPDAPFLHSLSTATRTQELPRPGALLTCQSAVWETAPTGDGTDYLRKTRESLTEAAVDDQQQPPADDSCRNPTKVEEHTGFDTFNLAARTASRVRELEAPFGLTVPAYERVTRSDHQASRAALAELGIVAAVSQRTITADGRLMTRETFTYRPDRGGRLDTRTLEVTSKLENVPDSLARFHKPRHSLIKTFDYDVFGNIVRVSDPLGVTESVRFEPTGVLPIEHRVHSGVDAAHDQVTRMTYDGSRAGLVHTHVTPLGMTVTYTYDALSRKISERAGDGAEKRYAYKLAEAGRPSMIMTSSRRYASAAETPAGESEWIDLLDAFNAHGNEVATVENVAEGGVRVFGFKQYNRNEKLIFKFTPFAIESFGGVSDLTVAKVFEAGNLPRPEGSVGNAYGYDALGRPVTESHPSGKRGRVAHHEWGTLLTTLYDDTFTGASVQEQHNVGNELGIAAHVAGDGQGERHVTRFVRDSFGYLSEIQLPGEATPRRLVHNTVGDLERQDVPGMGTYFYFYDDRGRQTVKARVSASGTTQVVELRYDFLNRKIAELVDGTELITYTYDDGVAMSGAAAFEAPIARPLDKPTRIVNRDPNGLHDTVQRFGYDRNGRLVQHEVEIAGESYRESYRRTLDGRITGSLGPGGLSSHFALGPDRNLRSVTIDHASFSGGPEAILENVAYNPEGRIARVDYRNDAFTELTYDPETLFLTRIVTEVQANGNRLLLQDLAMVFNQYGSINVITDNVSTAAHGHVDRSGRFEYDFKNQLRRILRYGEDARFDYSEAGTFTRNDEFAAGAALAASPQAATGLLPVGTADQPYSFDEFGQLASSPAIESTTFDAYGRLLKVVTAEHEVFFGYEQTGRRLYKKVVSRADPASSELYLFPLKSFTSGPRGDESYVFIGEARLVRMEHSTGRSFYYLKDHLSSSDYVMNMDGTPVEQMLYRAYGTEHAPEDLSSTWSDHARSIADQLPREKTHHRFTGQYLDDATGLYYYGARYYDPKLGRFISPDPLYLTTPERCGSNPTACNLFAYANNNPMAFIDPTGLDGVVAGDAAYRRQVEEQLQRLDPSARVDRETGEISQNWLHNLWSRIVDFFTPGPGHEAGRELVSRIIESEQTTTIQFAANNAGVDFDTSRGDPPPGPVDVTVLWDPSYTPPLPELAPGSNTPTYVPVDPAIAIGHELIHATHLMSGTDTGMGGVDYTGVNGQRYNSPDAEARTVGVGGTRQPDDITENQLREMLGINPRNHYE